MLDIKKNNKQIIIFFFFLSTKEKHLRNLIEFLKTYDIILHRNTKNIRKTLMLDKIEISNLALQANYIAASLQEIDEKQLDKILSLFSNKNINYIPFVIFYQHKILRARFTPIKKNENNSLLFYSITHD